MGWWRVARSILVLHGQLKVAHPDAAPPHTLPSTWGTVGDLSHQAGGGDHIPHDFPGWGDDVVTAGDFPRFGGLRPREVLDAIRRSKDGRVKYGISNGQMFSSYAARGIPAWTWRPYSGKDKHFEHGHLSVVGDPRADGTQAWQIGVSLPIEPTPAPTSAGSPVIYAYL